MHQEYQPQDEGCHKSLGNHEPGGQAIFASDIEQPLERTKVGKLSVTKDRIKQDK